MVNGRVSTRRRFLESTAVVSGYLFAPGLNEAVASIQGPKHQPLGSIPDKEVVIDDFSGIAINSPIILVTQSVSRDVDPRACTWTYITEIFHPMTGNLEEMETMNCPEYR